MTRAEDQVATDEADAALEALGAAKDRWARLPVARKIEYLDRLSREVLAAAEDWVAAAVRGKRIPPASPLVGEEWISGPYAVLAWIAAARDTLRAVAAGRSPLDGFDVWERPDGRAVVRVFPHGLKEQLLLHGYTVDVRDAAGRDRRRRCPTRWPRSTSGRIRPAASRSSSAPATSPRSRRSTCSTSSSPRARSCW